MNLLHRLLTAPRPAFSHRVRSPSAVRSRISRIRRPPRIGRRRCAAVGVLAVLLTAVGAPARSAPKPVERDIEAYRAAMEDADQKIAAAEKAHSEVMQNEEYLVTFIGPRLTGSPAMQKASRWTLDLFRKYGLDAHLETTQVPHAWSRGNDWGEITAPLQHWITVRSAAWSKATPGVVTGRLVILARDARPADILASAGRYKNAIVLIDRSPGPAELPPNPPSAYEAVVAKPHGLTLTMPMATAVQQLQAQSQITSALARVGVAAELLDSHAPDGLIGMGTAAYPPYEPSAYPEAFISHSDYQWLLRLARAGEATLRLHLEGTFSPGPAPASITVAQIKGSQHPDEQVILGGHLDSWDLGDGAVDNGTGAMAVVEAARLLKSLGWIPRRTLTFVLFTGEEQGGRGVESGKLTGGLGAQLFLDNHAGELDKVDAVLIDDSGAGRITSIPLENDWPTALLMARIYEPLQKVFQLDPITNAYFGGTDNAPFQWVGIPALLCIQEPAGYGLAHHTNADVFELVRPDALQQQAAVLAAWMWNVSELPESLPHHATGVKLEF